MIYLQYPDYEYFLIPFKIIEFILFLILTFKMIQLKKSTLNFMFAGAFISWLIYLIGDIYVNIFAADSLLAFQIANILRDVMVGGAMFTSFFLFLATTIILKSEKVLTKGFILLTLFLFILFVVLVDLNDSVIILVDEIPYISTLPPNYGIARAKMTLEPVAVIISAFPTLIYLYCVIALLRLTKSSSVTAAIKRKMYFLSIGIGFLAVGMIYYIILTSINVQTFITSPIGHIFWMIAPILIWLSQRHKEQK